MQSLTETDTYQFAAADIVAISRLEISVHRARDLVTMERLIGGKVSDGTVRTWDLPHASAAHEQCTQWREMPELTPEDVPRWFATGNAHLQTRILRGVFACAMSTQVLTVQETPHPVS